MVHNKQMMHNHNHYCFMCRQEKICEAANCPIPREYMCDDCFKRTAGVENKEQEYTIEQAISEKVKQVLATLASKEFNHKNFTNEDALKILMICMRFTLEATVLNKFDKEREKIAHYLHKLMDLMLIDFLENKDPVFHEVVARVLQKK